MKFEQIRKTCPKCGGLTITDFSVNPPSYEVVVRNWCPDGHYELLGKLEGDAVDGAPTAKESGGDPPRKRPRRSAAAHRTKA